MTPPDNAPTGIKVEIYKLANHLKAKLGMRFQSQTSGYLAPEAIAEIDRMVENLCLECPEKIGAHLESLSVLWGKMRDMADSQERKDISQKVFILAHEIKDIGAMCGYELIAYFAESLRDYIGGAELNIHAQKVIIQAHVDAMQAVHRMGIKNETGPEAEELKKMVKIAIDKFR